MTTTDAHAHTARICDRLRQAYAAQQCLPRADGLHTPPCEEAKTGRCVCEVRRAMSLNQLQRLYRAVIGEFV